MDVRIRLTVMQFLQFFAWGAWIVTAAAYYFETLNLTGTQVGALFGLMGIASLLTPGLVGMIADNWVSQERLYSLLQLVAGLALIGASLTTDYSTLFWLMLVNAFCFMPTLSLGYSLCYRVLRDSHFDVITAFPRIRVFGTIGFIAAMWTISISRWELSSRQFMVGGIAGIVLSLYALTLPHSPPKPDRPRDSIWAALGLRSLAFFRIRLLAVFLVFAFLMGTLLSLSSTWVSAFLHDFVSQPQYSNSLATQYPAVLISISQVSEIVFILLIPFFLRRFGIKMVMLLSFLAWAVRFALLGFGNPGSGVWMLVLAMIVYGCAFDFFNIAGSMFVETEVDESSRSSAQGLFMTMVNGAGGLVGGLVGGVLVDTNTVAGNPDWTRIWLMCSAYAIVLAGLFVVLFRYRYTAPNRGTVASPVGM
ncbi:MAG: MFS transporter [Actinomycetes bacterium]